MIATDRLILRVPEPGDRAAIVRMLSDQIVMAELYPGLDTAGAEAVLAKHDRLRGEGLGFLATVRRADGAVVGFCGLKRGEPGGPIAGLAEAGWLIDAQYWRQGYAYEAMAAVLAHGWVTIADHWIYAVTAAVNLKSQALMARLGMQRRSDGDYLSATFPDGHGLRPTVTFALARSL